MAGDKERLERKTIVEGVPQYSRMEYERRFVVEAESNWRALVKPYSRLFMDRYLACGLLRLRCMEDSDSGRTSFKLTKKYEEQSPIGQPIVSIWLTEDEYLSLRALPGYDLVKRRYYCEIEGIIFSIDEFLDERRGLILCEGEANSLEDLENLSFPVFARHEVTCDSFFRGGSLCRATQSEVQQALRLHTAP